MPKFGKCHICKNDIVYSIEVSKNEVRCDKCKKLVCNDHWVMVYGKTKAVKDDLAVCIRCQ
ncbi:MAG: hypothetical protein KAS32_15870 [Candidatus Peribacteraceae bacterium]|nr:hypothetical protein [Candidatus Peribacteraceae bacterium]